MRSLKMSLISARNRELGWELNFSVLHQLTRDSALNREYEWWWRIAEHIACHWVIENAVSRCSRFFQVCPDSDPVHRILNCRASKDPVLANRMVNNEKVAQSIVESYRVWWFSLSLTVESIQDCGSSAHTCADGRCDGRSDTPGY